MVSDFKGSVTLLVELRTEERDLFKYALEELGFIVHEASTWNKVAKQQSDLVITTLAYLQARKKEHGTAKIALLVGFVNERVARELVKQGITTILVYSGYAQQHIQEATGTSPLAALTPRELEVLKTIAASDRREAARQLHISEATVRSHLRHVFKKLGCRSMSEAVAILARDSTP